MQLRPIEQNIEHGEDAFTYTLREIPTEAGVVLWEFSGKSDVLQTPQKVSVRFNLIKDDIYAAFLPNEKGTATAHADWSMTRSYSRAMSGAPLHALVGKNDGNRCCIAVSDCKTPICIGTGVHEEDGTVRVEIEFFTDRMSPMTEYAAQIRIDCRAIRADRAIADVRTWWTACGYVSAPCPTCAALPMYSTWYSMHQHVTDEAILRQCRIAKSMGMETVIIDDGWQTEDGKRGYAYCGDWQVCTSKLGDFAALVRELHGIGVKTVVWFSVPYVGKNAAAVEWCKDKSLYYDARAEAYVLDPRFKEVRDYLTGTYADFVRKYDIDGFKLDFVDSFRLSEQSSVDYGNMDIVLLDEAVGVLMRDVSSTLRAVKPDIMIEYRQSYIGAVMQTCGNMLRVGDCPGNAFVNKVGSIGLRLMTDTCAVHADPILWHCAESAENAALQLNHTLFAVPQISVDLSALPAEHERMLRHYLAYMRDNRQTLLYAPLRVDGFAENFASATACGADKNVSAVFGRTVLDAEEKDTDIVNGSCGAVAVRFARDTEATVTVVDCMGNTVQKPQRKQFRAGINEIFIPMSGFAFLRFSNRKISRRGKK